MKMCAKLTSQNLMEFKIHIIMQLIELTVKIDFITPHRGVHYCCMLIENDHKMSQVIVCEISHHLLLNTSYIVSLSE